MCHKAKVTSAVIKFVAVDMIYHISFGRCSDNSLMHFFNMHLAIFVISSRRITVSMITPVIPIEAFKVLIIDKRNELSVFPSYRLFLIRQGCELLIRCGCKIDRLSRIALRHQCQLSGRLGDILSEQFVELLLAHHFLKFGQCDK